MCSGISVKLYPVRKETRIRLGGIAAWSPHNLSSNSDGWKVTRPNHLIRGILVNRPRRTDSLNAKTNENIPVPSGNRITALELYLVIVQTDCRNTGCMVQYFK
jgi:hypothetical protein